MRDRNRPPLVLLDPGNFTPGYDMNLGMSLMELGWDVEWVTSKHQFEELHPPRGLRVQEVFFQQIHRNCRAPQLHRTARRFMKGACYPADLLRFHRQMKERNPGILHVQWSHFPWLDAALWKWWQDLGWKIVYTAHDARPLEGTAPRWLLSSQRSLLHRADAVVVHSHNGLAALESLGAPADRIELLPPAPSLSAEPVLSRDEARKQLHLPPDQPIVLFFGFIKPYKGLSVLLRSFSRIRDAVNARLVVAGELMEPKRKYRALICESGIEDRVHWFDHYVPSSCVARYFAASDAVALPYLDASSSAVLLSAYSYSRPVVATTVGGLPELVSDGQTGILVPPRNPEALAQALIEILSDPERATRMGRCGLHRLNQNYTWTLLARHLSSLYQRVWNSPLPATDMPGLASLAPR